MHRVFLHLLFLSVVFFTRCIGRLCICVFFCHFSWGGRSASPPDALGVFACVVFFCLLLVFFLRDVLGSNVAVRGGNL